MIYDQTMLKKLFNAEKSIKISPSIVVFTVSFLMGLYFLYFIRNILVMLFAAVIVMAAINPGVKKLERKLHLPRILGIMIMYILVISLLSVLIALIVPPLTQELQNLTKMIDLLPLQNFVRNFKFDVNQINNFVSSFGGSVTTLWSIVNSTFSSLFTVLTITVISVYLLIDRDNLYKKISWFTRDKSQLEKAREFVDSVEVQLGGWIRGQLILMTIIGFVTYLGLLLLGIPYVLPLAILAGFLEILPNLGPTIASLPSIALAYVYGGWVLAGATALFYLIVQQLENNIVVPKIMKANADVNPLATIVTILVGLKMGGIVGALLSVPLYILIRAIYGMIRNDLIGKE